MTTRKYCLNFSVLVSPLSKSKLCIHKIKITMSTSDLNRQDSSNAAKLSLTNYLLARNRIRLMIKAGNYNILARLHKIKVKKLKDTQKHLLKSQVLK